MKKYWKLVIAAVAFVIFMAVVSVVYKNLAAEYKPQQNLIVQNGQMAEGVDNGTAPPRDKEVNSNVGQNNSEKESGKGQNNSEAEDDKGEGTSGTQGNGGVNQNDADATKENGAAGEDSQAERVDTAENIAPNFTVETVDGEEVSLHDFFGKPIVLNFWASWCGPCKMELPDFQEAYEKYGEEITFLMVNMTDGVQETKEIAMKYMEDAGYTLPVYYDTKQDAAYTYSVYSLPTTFFIGADGEAVAYAQGMIDAETLEKGISMIYP